GRGVSVVLTSHASICVPFFLGSLIALFFYPRLSDSSVTFPAFSLFMGIAMSITAFPVLARILIERGMLNTHLGSLAIVCAAVDDVTGWIVVAGVLMMVRAPGAGRPWWITALGVAVYIAAMHLGVRRALRGIYREFRTRGEVSG